MYRTTACSNIANPVRCCLEIGHPINLKQGELHTSAVCPSDAIGSSDLQAAKCMQLFLPGIPVLVSARNRATCGKCSSELSSQSGRIVSFDEPKGICASFQPMFLAKGPRVQPTTSLWRFWWGRAQPTGLRATYIRSLGRTKRLYSVGSRS